MNIIIFFAFFTLSLTGFGQALIAMPLLTPLMGLQVAAPVVALASLTGTITLLVYYRQHINLKLMWRYALASLAGIPLGVYLMARIDEKEGMIVLGILITGYGLYNLLNLRLPHIQNPRWAYGFGLLTGILSGAYNTGGPPAVIYAASSRWSPDEFRSNLQGISLLNSTLVIAAHAAAQHLTLQVWGAYLLSLPALFLGIAAGLYLTSFVRPEIFRKLVLILLVILGLRLVF
ncbi:MAG: sulfite exporter TauE/SafE family protein [Anaerolineae bacterium]|nr:sulfite exporter TauE/SafE family protein [Anaerolineae bacterium]